MDMASALVMLFPVSALVLFIGLCVDLYRMR